MCSFIKCKVRVDNVELLVESLFEVLDVKGGDEYNFVLEQNDFIQNISNDEIQKNWANLTQLFKNKMSSIRGYVTIIGFSRLTPEMEESVSSLPQPYINRKDNTIIVCHGTIPNAESIAKRNNIKINVDTELFNFLPFDYVCRQVEKEGGKISAFSYSQNDLLTYQNGLGMYNYNLIIGYGLQDIYNIEILTNIDCSKIDNKYKLIKEEPLPKPDESKPILISLFSGGLDITCSTQKAYEDIVDEHLSTDVHLWYFNWGTVASENEIKAGLAFKEKFSKTYQVPVNYKSFEIKPFFKSVLETCDMENTRLTDDDAKGAGSHEAESAISYVPYRNTLLMTLAAARAEVMFPGRLVYFVIGANLSEGMVYLDNSETWLTRMNNLIKVGGQRSANFNVIAPYVNRTKTAMIKDVIDRAYFYDTAFSCYFPVEGKECGKCGSCLLKANAIIRGNE